MHHTENLTIIITLNFILGIGYGLRFNYLFRFLKSLRKSTRFVLGLVYENYGAPHSESFDMPRTPSRTKR